MITIEKLIEALKEKNQKAVVECIVVETDGRLVCMYVSSWAKKMINFLKMLTKNSADKVNPHDFDLDE